jgi:hypothetical protein
MARTGSLTDVNVSMASRKTGTTYAQASAYLTAMKATEELTWLNEVSSLRATATGTVVRVFRDRASGLREGRLGLEKLLAATADGG